jgi:hypothetical protein
MASADQPRPSKSPTTILQHQQNITAASRIIQAKLHTPSNFPSLKKPPHWRFSSKQLYYLPSPPQKKKQNRIKKSSKVA